MGGDRDRLANEKMNAGHGEKWVGVWVVASKRTTGHGKMGEAVDSVMVVHRWHVVLLTTEVGGEP